MWTMIDDVIHELLNCNIQLLFHIYRCIEYSVNAERSGIKMRIDLLTDVARGWPGSCKHNSDQLSKGHSYDLARAMVILPVSLFTRKDL